MIKLYLKILTMTRKLFLVGTLHIFVACSALFAQSYKKISSLEFGLLGGVSHYSGDLVNGWLATEGLGPSFGLITRWNPNPIVTFRISGTFNQVSGDDRWYPNIEERANRNLHFKSNIYDFTGAVELSLVQISPRQERGVVPYLMTGLSVFSFQPKAQFDYDAFMNSKHASNLSAAELAAIENDLKALDKEWVDLQPLSTEGQESTEYNERRRYPLTQLAIPLGLGVKIKLNKNWNLGLEYATRVTFTDYLDDVSSTYPEPLFVQAHNGPMAAYMSDRSLDNPPKDLAKTPRGDDSKFDFYSILGLSISYRINSTRAKCPTF